MMAAFGSYDQRRQWGDNTYGSGGGGVSSSLRGLLNLMCLFSSRGMYYDDY
jgi:hypothetical protein